MMYEFVMTALLSLVTKPNWILFLFCEIFVVKLNDASSLSLLRQPLT